ncbi:hypothetical protein D3C72_1461710 [compost metagenome]
MALTAPMMPVAITSTAVSDGRPPIFSATPIAIGMVTDFGASERTVSGEAPSSQAMPTADTTATTEPATRPASSGNTWVRSLGSCMYSGTASATVAGPSRKCTNCAPSK